MRACLVTLLAPVLASVLAGCPAGAEDYPIAPGGYGSSNGIPGVDAAIDADPNGLSGRVCALQDLRMFSRCAVSGLLGLTVTLGGSSVLTADDGSFSMVMPTTSNLVWRVSGTLPSEVPIVPSLIPYSGSNVLPAVDSQTYSTLLVANDLAVAPGQGSIIARVVQAGQPATEVTVTQGAAVNGTLYDGDRATTWDSDLAGTGPLGVAWLTGVPVGAATLMVTPPLGAPTNPVQLVEQLSISFPTIEIP